MTTLQEVAVGTKISFEVYPSAQYGTNFQSVTLVSVLDANTAQLLGFDINAAHARVYSTVPAGTMPNDPTQYNYFRFKYDSGSYAILGVPWIRDGTLTISDGKKLTLVFEDIDETRKDRIIKAIKAQNETPTSQTFV